MTTEAEHIAGVFEHFAKDHEPNGYPAVQQKLLSEAAALLRQQAAEIERLKEELEDWRFTNKVDELCRSVDKANVLLRQALDALRHVLRGSLSLPRFAESSAVNVITAIKTHLGEQG